MGTWVRVVGPPCPSPTPRRIRVQRDPLSLQKSGSRDRFATEGTGGRINRPGGRGADGPWLAAPKATKGRVEGMRNNPLRNAIWQLNTEKKQIGVYGGKFISWDVKSVQMSKFNHSFSSSLQSTFQTLHVFWNTNGNRMCFRFIVLFTVSL